MRAARSQFEKVGRNPAAEGSQAKFSRQFVNDVAQSMAGRVIEAELKAGKKLKLTASDRKAGVQKIDTRAINADARVKAQEVRGFLNALHEPDNVAGGWFNPKPTRMGNASVNQSIGGSWPVKKVDLDAYAKLAADNGMGNSRMNVRLKIETNWGG